MQWQDPVRSGCPRCCGRYLHGRSVQISSHIVLREFHRLYLLPKALQSLGLICYGQQFVCAVKSGCNGIIKIFNRLGGITRVIMLIRTLRPLDLPIHLNAFFIMYIIFFPFSEIILCFIIIQDNIEERLKNKNKFYVYKNKYPPATRVNIYFIALI